MSLLIPVKCVVNESRKMGANSPHRTTVLARYPVRLNLPDGDAQLVEDAAEAVRREYRSSVRWKRLCCRKVESLTQQRGETIFVLEIGRSVEFDWTWEGAVAFRPADINTFTGDIDTTDDFVSVLPSNGRQGVWTGEIVEVDETNGKLFVSVSTPDSPPCTGTFFVRPFEFLTFLHSIFCGTDWMKALAPRLNASCGDVHPRVTAGSTSQLPEFEELWNHSWGILWGPPGTGKTHNLGRQVASILNDPTERVLVLSTTNRATDAAALAIGRAALTMSPASVGDGRILRIGKGADWSQYQGNHLEGLLRGTETDILRQMSQLNRQLEKARTHEDRAKLRDQIKELRRSMKDSAFNIFACPDVQVVVGTAFKATALLNDPSIRAMVASGASPFTTVIVDEAGLMSRAAVSALSLLASRRVLVVGDAKQLAPISKVSRILPTGQATWLASSCLSHLQGVQQTRPGVDLLRRQYRMHPDVSRVVSHFQYEDVLEDDVSVMNRQAHITSLPQGQPRAIWYVLDEDCHDLPSIRAERGPGNKSWVRRGTHDVLAKLFSHTSLYQAQGLFITPFRAQAKEIASYFAKEHLEGWSAGTVHSRQGTEADVVIFDTVNAGSTGWPHDEWKRLVNVGLSRAREFLVVVASRAEMNEPYLRPLLDTLAPRILKRANRSMVWAEVPARVTFEVPL